MKKSELLPHLFRIEFGKITSVLVKHFSLEHIEVAEDIASETFLLAMETWPYKGIPQNPTAWLYTVAKNKTKNFLYRNKIGERVHAAISPLHKNTGVDDVDLSVDNIKDSQLKTLFALCHPSLPPESQIAICLRILCGFGIDEIATAFLSNKETINKRLTRAREKLRTEKIQIELPEDNQLVARLENVLTTLYLLFSEGYYSETNEFIVREELCLEAIHLTQILVCNSSTNIPSSNALLALMYFQASRLKSRTNANGGVVLYHDQDPNDWNQQFISLGAYYLNHAAHGDKLTKYHLEATIAYWHTVRADSKEKWENILQLYNHLLQIEYSPIAALNRTYALAKANSTMEAINEAKKLNLTTNPYYFTLLGELHQQTDPVKAKFYFEEAVRVSKSHAEKIAILQKLETLNAPSA